jgi:hypothetical protein
MGMALTRLGSAIALYGLLIELAAVLAARVPS